MKLVVLAGGYGTRLSEETRTMPKPMVSVGSEPILMHVLRGYAQHGVTDFIVACGYRGDVIRDYFNEYALRGSDVTFNLASGETMIHVHNTEPWTITLVETGETTQTGGRIKRLRAYLDDDEDFCLTYGDGVGNVDIAALVAFHKARGRSATVTAVHPPPRFGALTITRDRVKQYVEKPDDDGGWISAGYFVLSPSVLDLIEDDDSVWELGPLAQLTADGQLSAYKHHGFWHPMDNLSDRHTLEGLWATGKAPWKVW